MTAKMLTLTLDSKQFFLSFWKVRFWGKQFCKKRLPLNQIFVNPSFISFAWSSPVAEQKKPVHNPYMSLKFRNLALDIGDHFYANPQYQVSSVYDFPSEIEIVARSRIGEPLLQIPRQNEGTALEWVQRRRNYGKWSRIQDINDVRTLGRLILKTSH